jgi:uncharacterized cupredoxin-like copper-binding protein
MHHTSRRFVAIVAALAALAALTASACGSSEATANPTAVGTPQGTVAASAAAGAPIVVSLAEYSVTVDAESAPAGSTTFSVANSGAGEHQFVVIRTDESESDLPLTPDSVRVDEAAVEVVNKIEGIPVGQTQEVTVDLPAGAYVFICNVPGHYEAGMHVAFTATP